MAWKYPSADIDPSDFELAAVLISKLLQLRLSTLKLFSLEKGCKLQLENRQRISPIRCVLASQQIRRRRGPILVLNQTPRHFSVCSPRKPTHGACLDTSAHRTIIEFRQAHAYSRFTCTKLQPVPSSNIYRFVNECQSSLHSLSNSIPLTNTHGIVEQVDVFRPNVTLLVGIDLLYKYRMFSNSITNQFY